VAQYYFVVTSLPPLSFETRPEITFEQFLDLLKMNLSKKVKSLLFLIDLANIRALWMELPFDGRGNFTVKELEQALLTKEGLPADLIDFLDRYESTQDRLRYFSSLYVASYARASAEKRGFLKKLFTFDRDVRLILTALRAKVANRDLAREFQFEDPTDPLVMDFLLQKESNDLTVPAEYEELKELFLKHRLEPMALNRAILEYRFVKIEEMMENGVFSIDSILSYAARLMIVESWWNLDEKQGRLVVEDLSKYG
jgi:hypothetical protein